MQKKIGKAIRELESHVQEIEETVKKLETLAKQHDKALTAVADILERQAHVLPLP